MPPVYIYHCVNRSCREWRRKKEKAMPPSEFRRATGGSVQCHRCGDVMVYDGEQLNLFQSEEKGANLSH